MTHVVNNVYNPTGYVIRSISQRCRTIVKQNAKKNVNTVAYSSAYTVAYS